MVSNKRSQYVILMSTLMRSRIVGKSIWMSCLIDVKEGDKRHLDGMSERDQGVYEMNKQSRGERNNNNNAKVLIPTKKGGRSYEENEAKESNECER